MNDNSNQVDSNQLTHLKRRDFLTLCAVGGALPTLLSANTSGPAYAMANSSKQRSLSSSDWGTLARTLRGQLVLPASPRYAIAHQTYSPRFDNVQPAAIAYCSSAADVQTCLTFVKRFGMPLAMRAGGHSYAGYSTINGGLVIDVTHMNTITVNTLARTATVGAGARLVDVYAALAAHNLALPAGSCGTVGIAGLTLGGGIGVIGRKFGLTCDNLIQAQVVLANNRAITCNAHTNADLFWALRGGGGGNFGVITAFTFNVHPVSTLALFSLTWPWSSAADVIGVWQNWAPQQPDELWTNCALSTGHNKKTDPVVKVSGVYVGGIAPLQALLQNLTNQIGVGTTDSQIRSDTVLNTMLDEAGCLGMTVNQCHLSSQTAQGQMQRDTYGAKSDFFLKTLSRAGIAALVNAINIRHANADLNNGSILLDAFGGAINRVATDATAFVHRQAQFSAQYLAGWNPNDPDNIVAENHDWLTSTWQAMRPHASGFAYQNYIDANLPNWQQAYYGSNLPVLQHIKAVYDPGNLFRFAQSITPTN